MTQEYLPTIHRIIGSPGASQKYRICIEMKNAGRVVGEKYKNDQE